MEPLSYTLMIGTAFAAARIELGLRSRTLQPDDPAPWGKQKAGARRAALKKGIADTNAKFEALNREFLERSHILIRKQLSYVLDLAEVEITAMLKDEERARRADRRMRSAQSAGPAEHRSLSGCLCECAAWGDPDLEEDELWEQEDWDETDTVPSVAAIMDCDDGVGEEQLLPDSHLLQSSVAAADERAQSAEQSDPEEEPGLDLKALYALVAASAPGWLDVDAPPPSVSTRFPLCGMRIGDLAELGPLDLGDLLPLLPEISDASRPALPATADHLLTWLWSGDGAGYREPLQRAIWREQARRLVWPDLLEWHGWVLALAPGGPGGTTTPQEAEREFDRSKEWYRRATDPLLRPVWDELVMLLPERPWLASGTGLHATFDEGSSGTSAYDDDDDPEDSGTT